METTIATTKKKSIKQMIFLVLSLLTAVSMFMSCDPMDPDFQEGFRYGWNQTAPDEYKY